ncbi:MAG: hypothetical protein AB7I37_26915, partial [Pirellulales bacterium]
AAFNAAAADPMFKPPKVPRPDKSKKKGPPAFFDDDDRRHDVKRMFGVGMSQREVARHMGCSHTTLGRAMRNDEYFRAEIRNYRRNFEYVALSRIDRAGSTSWRAAAWMLERMRPEIYGKQSRPTFDQIVDFFEQNRDIMLAGLYPEQVEEKRQVLEQLAVKFAGKHHFSRDAAYDLVPLATGEEEDDDGNPLPRRPTPPPNLSPEALAALRGVGTNVGRGPVPETASPPPAAPVAPVAPVATVGPVAPVAPVAAVAPVAPAAPVAAVEPSTSGIAPLDPPLKRYPRHPPIGGTPEKWADWHDMQEMKKEGFFPDEDYMYDDYDEAAADAADAADIAASEAAFDAWQAEQAAKLEAARKAAAARQAAGGIVALLIAFLLGSGFARSVDFSPRQPISVWAKAHTTQSPASPPTLHPQHLPPLSTPNTCPPLPSAGEGPGVRGPHRARPSTPNNSMQPPSTPPPLKRQRLPAPLPPKTRQKWNR